MTANDNKLQSPYNVEETLGSLINKFNECEDFAASAGEPSTDIQLFRIAYGLVAETSEYAEYCQVW